MIAALCLLLLLVPGATALQAREPPQDPTTPTVGSDHGIAVRIEAVPGVHIRSLWIALPLSWAGEGSDTVARRRLLGECLRLSMPPASALEPNQIVVLDDVILVGRIVSDDTFESVMSEVAGWFRGTLALGDPDLELARDRAVLSADDDTVVRPGPILRGRALRTLGRSSEAAALTPDQVARMHAMTAVDIRAAFRDGIATEGAAIAVLGGEDAAPLDRQLSALLARIERIPRRSVSPRAAALPVEQRDAVHDRVLGPYVLAAIGAPAADDPAFPIFMVAAEVLRARAVFRLGDARGNELRAGFPPIVFDGLVEPAALFVERRGRDGAEVEAARNEITAVLKTLERAPPDDLEISTAVDSLRIACALPPFDERMRNLLAANHSVLLSRGKVVLFDLMQRIPTVCKSTVAPIDTASVRRLIAGRFAADQVEWFSLRAPPKPTGR